MPHQQMRYGESWRRLAAAFLDLSGLWLAEVTVVEAMWRAGFIDATAQEMAEGVSWVRGCEHFHSERNDQGKGHLVLSDCDRCITEYCEPDRLLSGP